jgi:hypothetical protein
VYRIFSALIQKRRELGIREDDIIQTFIDDGDEINTIVGFSIDYILASYINLAIITWTQVYFAMNLYWVETLCTEAGPALDKCGSDKSSSLLDRFSQLSF